LKTPKAKPITQAPERIFAVSHGIFSVARHFGGCTAFGASYTYDPDADELIRDDLFSRERAATLERARWEKARAAADFEKARTATLFGEERP